MQLFSQSIGGVVVNAENNHPVSSANIVVKNSTVGAVSDRNGKFQLETEHLESALVQVSCVGFETQELDFKTIDSGNNLEIQLRPVPILLNKSIVVTASRNQLLSFQRSRRCFGVTGAGIKTGAPRSIAEALIGTTGFGCKKQSRGGSPIVRGLTGNQHADAHRRNPAQQRYVPLRPQSIL